MDARICIQLVMVAGPAETRVGKTKNSQLAWNNEL